MLPACLLSAVMVLTGSGCEEEGGAPPAAPDAPSADDSTSSGMRRQSTLGKAYDAGERTRDRIQDYNRAIEDEIDRKD